MQTPANEEPFPAFLHVGKYKVFIYYLKISYKNRMCFDRHILPFPPQLPTSPLMFPSQLHASAWPYTYVHTGSTN